jgi:hypothetical protein
MNNDCHFYDGPIKDTYHHWVSHLDNVDKNDEINIWKDILNITPDDLKSVILKLFNEDITDFNVGDRPRNLGARIWLKVKGNKDMEELFFNQLRDMRDTNGYCSQGRTNRFIQVLFACMS